ncbi:G surface protein, allelic form 168-like [Physella acuta]|uniref:G surface protein, allelic form 168-like n=1 Tax=Physella acuta TaxID=109671 RepID=UPI0027DAF3CE|nr:G surface protein, allelic form 168-like [Physella acuta]
MNLIKMESIKYLTLFVLLVSVIAGNDVITFNQDETSMEDNIDHILEHEQFIKVGDIKKPTKPAPSAQQRKESKLNTESADQLNTRKSALTLSSNCTKSHNHLISKYNVTKHRESDVVLQFDDMSMMFEEDELISDYTDDAVLSRRKRKVANPIEYSGTGPIAYAEVKLQGNLVGAQADHDSAENKAFRSHIEVAMMKFLQTLQPNKKFSVEVMRLRSGSIIAEVDLIFDFPTVEMANSLIEMQKQGSLNINGINYRVEDIQMKASGQTTTVPLICYNCIPGHQVCEQGSANQWSCVVNSTFFYSYGRSQGDDTLQKDAEFATKRIEFPNLLPWDNQLVRFIWISVNGLISIGEEFASYNPDRNIFRSKRVIYPYWTDLDSVSSDRGQVFYQVYTSSRSDEKTKHVLNRARNDVEKYSSQSFTPSTVVVATWNDIPPWPASSSSTERVTFQCIIITDGFTSYTMFLYGQGVMSLSIAKQRAVEVGWGRVNLDSRYNYYIFDQVTGNTGLPGAWFYKIGEKENFREKCVQWFSENMWSYQSLMWWNRAIPQCPCNEFSALFSGTWLPSFEQSQCYDIFPSFGRFGRRCCYRGNSIENRMPIAGSLQVSTPYFGDYYSHELLDNQPKRWCCDQSDLCQLYYTVRPQAACSPFFPFRSFGFGDPHIVTLDQLTYIFNGLGEFQLTHIVGVAIGDTNNTDFKMQSRTCRASNSNGTLTDATIWCGLAFRTTSNETVRIEIVEAPEPYMSIYANNQDFSVGFRDNANFTVKQQGLYLRRLNDSLKISTSDSIGVTISLANRMLEFSLEIDSKFKGMPRGLLGNFNDDKSDEFIFPNGTQLSNSSSERAIYAYGLTWAITSAADSLFFYGFGQSPATFTNTSFVPIFLDEVNATVRSEAERVCDSSTNLPCIFDFIATRNEQLAKSTMAAASSFEKEVQSVSNRAPVINGTSNIVVTVNETITFELVGSDADNDNISFVKIEAPAVGFNYISINDSFIANFTPKNIEVTSISIVATDSKGISSEVIKMSITICSGCNGHGICNFTEILNQVSPYFTVVTCECNPGYDGDHCEHDMDGCANNPCPQQTTCTDMSAESELATGKSYFCSNCPTGFQLGQNGTKCEDVNECLVNGTNPCGLNTYCTNTFGGYTCTCVEGFRKSGDRCVDINECIENQHNCEQVCINLVPLFKCDCLEGFKISGSAQNSCTRLTQIDPCANISSQPCEYGCTNATGAPKCFCKVGEKLSTNGYSCEDIDECAEKLCSQDCTNSIGSYSCSCFDGFKISDQDKLSCEPCTGNKYGKNCEQTCECRGRSTACDRIKGCICEPSWTGTSCEIDVDECFFNLDNCRPDQICTNTNGSFTCTCPRGYDDVNGTCSNVNECLNPLNDCAKTLHSVCVDNPGSFSCMCKDGYIFVNNTCQDINECSTEVNGCEHNCVNMLGSYNCECFPGFVLGLDRKKCSTAFEVCANANLNCSHGCTIINGTTQCFCERGYILMDNRINCIDINECETSENMCSDNCTNSPGSYNCSCPNGKRLQNDRRTCQVCDDFHWGYNCENTCSCNPVGTSKCDPVNGCICMKGFTGITCYDDINECSNATICPQNSVCNNTVGSYHCRCQVGFRLENNSCVNINECITSRPCDHICNDTYGSYTCSCHRGFQSVGDKCIDIDECSNSTLNTCEQICRNTQGGYACDCNEGFVLNVTTRTTCNACDASYFGKDCANQCKCNMTNTVDCNDVTGFCTCKAGWSNDTCNTACDETHFGNNCSNTCSCNMTNTLDCDHVTGACTCKPGWSGDTCNKECDATHYGENCSYACSCNMTNTHECDDATGACTCNPGWSGNDCNAACDTTHYGTNCTQICQCVEANTADCSDINGTCTCKLGWTGTKCDTDIDECGNTSYCPDPHDSCYNVNGTAQCRCDEGFVLSNLTCQACDTTHYGTNCSTQCQCVIANTADCNDTNGACTCKQGWNGIFCQTDIDECLNSSYCPDPHDYCYNLNGSAECRCDVGFTKPSSSALCQVCNGTHYGVNCSLPCGCVLSNTIDCNETDGSCRCKTGWTGTKCDTDINECGNTSYCPDPHDSCYNLNGTAECRCDVGFTKPSSSALCQACDATHYGTNCSNTCLCIVANTADCNDTFGTCTCKTGWTGTNCDLDIDECSNSSYCGQHEECHNLNGSAECRCVSGYQKLTPGALCQVCNGTHYGVNCSLPCGCVLNNTIDCNETDGSCRCKTGWTGTKCDTDINECLNTSYCPDPHDSCYNLNGTAQCRCDDGFVFSALNSSCQACDTTHYGTNCSTQCQCVIANTADCNDTNGACICKQGWNGFFCQTDIDECLNSSYCPDPHDYCYNLNGSAECRCDVGFTKPSSSALCQACDATHYGTNCSSTCLCIVANTADCNDTFGTCTCKTGWTGTNCDLDIDECSNSSYCGQHEECHNLNGSAECRCVSGYQKLTPGALCQVCNGTHYGVNCSLPCGCVLNNTIDCNETDGSCRCKTGWTGTKCDTDINECLNTSYCPDPHDSCYNLNGTAQCRCDDGFVFSALNSSCQACDTTHYGTNCSTQCQCVIANTADCNDTNGACICKQGWNGFFCQTDIDECLNSSYCPDPHDYCYNLNGSAECRCDVGFTKPSSSALCQVCNGTHYGVNCSLPCGCVLSNTIDCNETDGSCRCKTGWTGTKCDTDIDECGNTSYCPDPHDSCYNLNGTAECRCDVGFTKPSSSALCQACDATHYGTNCSSTCLCIVANTADCNDTFGTCTCKTGWTGTNCDLDIDECSNSSYCGQHEECHNLNGSAECRCVSGYQKLTPGALCQVCNGTHYGVNCSLPCSCVLNNTIDCNETDGSCRCKTGWTGTKCDTDIDECLNTSYCPDPHDSCYNLNGTAQCRCDDGFVFSALNSSCQACDTTHYGTNCSTQCQCVIANTADCNDTNGACICKQGWNGFFCQTDIDECLNSSYCPDPHDYCYNLNGSAECRCDVGFTKPSSSALCQVCNGTHYGVNCSLPCGCVLSNTIDCNETDGSCRCKIGWTGTKCDTDINECLNTSYCPDPHDSCYNLNGTAECRCDVGFTKPSSSALCQACDATHYGTNCSNTCLCIVANTADCNDTIGTCTCKTGWTGTKCDTDIDECGDTSYCPDPHDSCYNLNGSAECRCDVGFTKPSSSALCQACDATHYGTNCSNTCLCIVANTADCNDTIGTCTCKTGWTGTNCDLDINECSNSSYCGQHEECHNLNGSAECRCVSGYQKLTPGALCQVCNGTHYGVNCSLPCGCVLNNTVDCNETDGSCRCKTGWTGTKCDTDIDECGDTSYCPDPHDSCYNLNGSAECRCDVGFTKPSSSALCQACDATHYGTNCSNTCLCIVANTADCNDTIGTCTCKPGWTGTNCDLDINECSNSSYCGQHEECHNLNGSAECRCVSGYQKLTPGALCQVCDANHYGSNCNKTCSCNMTNTVDCDDVSGDCTCKPGWSGANCNTVCDANHYGSNCNKTCSCNMTNTVDCDDVSGDCTCKPGWSGANCNTVCDANHYGSNCNKTCSCNMTNTVDCDDVSGDCTCKPGWSGANCNTVCDANHYGSNCNKTCSCNMTNTVDCDDVSGDCTCKPGWSGANCNTVCDANHYGSNCNKTCSCNMTNTVDCDDVSGDCTCKPGWSGANCNTVCDTTHFGANCNNTCSCNMTNTVDCDDVSGACTCKTGWNGPMCNSVCNATHYGANCSIPCNCNMTNTFDCDDVSGACTCKPGWSGTICNTVCDANHYGSNCNKTCSCNITNTVDCDDVSGDCTCKPGWSGTICNTVCDANHYGSNCNKTCSCNMTNTVDCNDVSGDCTCKPGWSGANCNTAEIATYHARIIINYDFPDNDTSLVDNTTEKYWDLKNKIENHLNNLGQLLGQGKFVRTIVIGIRKGSLIVDTMIEMSNKTEENPDIYAAAVLSGYVVSATFEINNKTYPAQVVTTQEYNYTKDSSVCDIFNALSGCENNSVCIVSENNLPVCPSCDATHYGANCSFSCSCNMTNTQDCNDATGACTCKPGWSGAICNTACGQNMYGVNCSNTCNCVATNTQQCDRFTGKCTCKPGWFGTNCSTAVTAEANHDLTIGLAVGIPLFVILAVTVAVIVWCCIKRKSANQTQGSTPSLDRDAPFRSIFATQIATKGSWGTPSLYSPDAYSEAGTSEGSRDGKLIRGKRSGFKDSAWYDGQGTSASRDTMKERNAPKPEGQTANFSWEYMFKLLEPHKDFEIVRPNYSPSPNPAYVPKNKKGDSNA